MYLHQEAHNVWFSLVLWGNREEGIHFYFLNREVIGCLDEADVGIGTIWNDALVLAEF